MTSPKEQLPPARELLPYEERVRLHEEVVPKLFVTGESACGRARAVVGHECALASLWLAWEKLKEDLEFKRGSRNEPLGHVVLARVIETAVHAATDGMKVEVTQLYHKPAPPKASLDDQYYDDYWSLPEHVRPDTPEDYIAERRAAEGPPPKAEQQREADERAAKERVAQLLQGLETDPKVIRRSDPGVVLPQEVADAKERSARLSERLASVDWAAMAFEGKDDEHSPSVVVTASFASPFALWLHPEVFTRVGSRLDKVVIAAAAKAKAKLAAAVRGEDGLSEM